MQVKCASCERSVYVGDPPPGGVVEVSCEGCLTELIVTSTGEVRLAKKVGVSSGFAPLAAPAAPLPGIPAAPRPPGLGPAAPLPSAVPAAPLPSVPRFTPAAPGAAAPLPTLVPTPSGSAPLPGGMAPLPPGLGPISVPRPLGVGAPMPGLGGTGPISPLGRGTGPIPALTPTTPFVPPSPSGIPRAPAAPFVPPAPPTGPVAVPGFLTPGAPAPAWSPAPGPGFAAQGGAARQPAPGLRPITYDDATAITAVPVVPDPEVTRVAFVPPQPGLSIHEQQTVIGVPALTPRPEDVEEEPRSEPTMITSMPGFGAPPAAAMDEPTEIIDEISDVTEIGMEPIDPGMLGAPPLAGGEAWGGMLAPPEASEVGPLESVAAAAGMPFAEEAPPLGMPDQSVAGEMEIDYGDADEDVDESTAIVRNPLDSDSDEDRAESTAVVLHPLKERSRRRLWMGAAAAVVLLGGGGAAAFWAMGGEAGLQRATAAVPGGGTGEAQLDQIVKELEGKSEDELAGTVPEPAAGEGEAAEPEGDPGEGKEAKEGKEGKEAAAVPAEPAGEGEVEGDAEAGDSEAEKPATKKKVAKKKAPKNKAKARARKPPKKKAAAGGKKKESIDSLFE